MKRNFWKASGISLAAYAGALMTGVWIDFRLTLFALLALQVTWTLFCVVRLLQLRRGGAHRPTAEAYAREDYGFALGGSVSSLALFATAVVMTQAV